MLLSLSFLYLFLRRIVLFTSLYFFLSVRIFSSTYISISLYFKGFGCECFCERFGDKVSSTGAQRCSWGKCQMEQTDRYCRLVKRSLPYPMSWVRMCVIRSRSTSMPLLSYSPLWVVLIFESFRHSDLSVLLLWFPFLQQYMSTKFLLIFPTIHPYYSSSSSSGVIDMGSSVDISVAVATPNGLITPIVTGKVVKFRWIINNWKTLIVIITLIIL